ncbi:hypothetical protein D3C72_1441620 [compost metagenome]
MIQIRQARSIMIAISVIARPATNAPPKRMDLSPLSTSAPSPSPPMIAQMMTVENVSMITWFNPVSSVARAAGTCTFQHCWRGVQPVICASSTIDCGVRRKANVVIRAIGGMA